MSSPRKSSLKRSISGSERTDSPKRSKSDSLSPPPGPPRKSATLSAIAKPVRKPFQVSKGHGAHSETGGLKRGKTELRPSGLRSLNANLRHAIDGGTGRMNGGMLTYTAVPRASKPHEMRLMATKSTGGNGKDFTSFPVSAKNVPDTVLRKTGLQRTQFVDAPRSPERKT